MNDDNLIEGIFSDKTTCNRCDAPLKVSYVEEANRLAITREHFCSFFNGVCKVTMKYKPNAKEKFKRKKDCLKSGSV